jgi:hypothetical protein
MFLEISKAEEFMQMLEVEDKEIPVFLGQLTQYDQTGSIATVYISVQFQYDKGMIIRYKELVGSSWLARDENDIAGKQAVEKLNATTITKHDSIKNLIEKKGYTNIVAGVWVSQ